jgi:signal transduction histidine kinase
MSLLIFFYWMTALIAAENGFGQSYHLTPTVLERLEAVDLGSLAYFVDPRGSMNVKDVSQSDFQKNFIKATPETLAFGYTTSHYWVSFSIRNETAEETWYLLPNHPLLQTQVYRIADNGTPIPELMLKERYSIGEMQLKPQAETRFLVHVTSRAALSLQFKIMTNPSLTQRLYQESMFLSAMVGCYLSILLYNSFLYFTLRDHNYLYYLFFALINCHLDLLTVNFPLGIWEWLGIPWWNIIAFYRPIAPLSALLFARSFLQIKSNHPVLDRCILFYIVGLGLLIVLSFIVPVDRLMTLTDLYFLLGILFLLHLGIYRLKEGFTPAIYYLAGLGTFLFGVAICLMQMMGWLPSHPLTINALVVAHGLEMILMSLALGGRFKLIQEQKVRAEVTATMKSHLLRTISHDIYNPLTIVKGHSRLLQNERPGSKSIESIQRAVGVIEDIMRFVQKTEYLNQGTSLPLTSVSIQDVFATLAFLFEDRAREKGIRLEFSQDTPELAVWAEKTSLCNEVLGNLLSNAIKFTLPGHVIRVDARRHKPELVVISVQDEGIGMSAEILENLFNPQQNRSLKGTHGEQGIGYGMPLAKAFIDAYGAMIEVESTPILTNPESSGTVFRIFIKAAG